MRYAEAKRAASKVYERLLAQGRAEPQARRDAEKWVKGNYGVDVSLPAPSAAPTVRCARCGKGQRKLFWVEGELARQESLCLDCIRRAFVESASEPPSSARASDSESLRRARAAEETERLWRRHDEDKERRFQERLKRQQEHEQERQRRAERARSSVRAKPRRRKRRDKDFIAFVVVLLLLSGVIVGLAIDPEFMQGLWDRAETAYDNLLRRLE